MSDDCPIPIQFSGRHFDLILIVARFSVHGNSWWFDSAASLLPRQIQQQPLSRALPRLEWALTRLGRLVPTDITNLERDTRENRLDKVDSSWGSDHHIGRTQRVWRGRLRLLTSRFDGVANLSVGFLAGRVNNGYPARDSVQFADTNTGYASRSPP